MRAPQGRTADRDALTSLVKEHVGEGRPLTLRVFAERAIDPKTGTTISKSTVGNLVTGSRIKITPEVLGAIAAGLGVPLRLVQAAAAEQYVGLAPTDSAHRAARTTTMSEQTPQLSADLQRIKATATKHRDNAERGPAGHYIEFSTQETSLATFESDGPMYTPTAGQRVMVHGIYVLVTEVDVAYEMADDGRSVVFASVEVTDTEQ